MLSTPRKPTKAVPPPKRGLLPVKSHVQSLTPVQKKELDQVVHLARETVLPDSSMILMQQMQQQQEFQEMMQLPNRKKKHKHKKKKNNKNSGGKRFRKQM